MPKMRNVSSSKPPKVGLHQGLSEQLSSRQASCVRLATRLITSQPAPMGAEILQEKS
jgi:hypothetical protein